MFQCLSTDKLVGLRDYNPKLQPPVYITPYIGCHLFEKAISIILCYKLGYFRFNADICKKIKQIKFSQAKVVKEISRPTVAKEFLQASGKSRAKPLVFLLDL